eukprot:13286538-Alexandrium_andersonii.AAC.1
MSGHRQPLHPRMPPAACRENFFCTARQHQGSRILHSHRSPVKGGRSGSCRSRPGNSEITIVRNGLHGTGIRRRTQE